MKPTMQYSQNCQNLNPTPFQMIYRGQVLQRYMTAGLMSLFHTSHYFRLLFTIFSSTESLASVIIIYAEHYHKSMVYDENFLWGLHVRSVGCHTCHALRMWSNTAHDVYSISPSHLSCLSLLCCPIKQTSQEIKQMPLKLPQLAKVQCQSQCHKFLQFHVHYSISHKKM